MPQDYKTSQESHQNLNITKSLQLVNNSLYLFNKLIKILPQHTEIEQNRERLVAKFSTAEKNCKGFRRLGRSKIGKTLNIHGKICR